MLNNHELVFAVVINDSDYIMAIDKVGGGTLGTDYTCEDWRWTLYNDSEDRLKVGEFHMCTVAFHWDAMRRVNAMIVDGDINPSNVSEVVYAGMKLLGRFIPNWRRLIDADTLDLASTRYCILGQVFGSYSSGLEYLAAMSGESVDEEWYGFCADEDTTSLELTDEWKKRLSD